MDKTMEDDDRVARLALELIFFFFDKGCTVIYT